MRRFAAAPLLVAIVLAGAACASAPQGPPPPPYYTPSVGLRDVRFAGAGIRGGALEISLNVYNPNDYELRDPRFEYRILVGDDKVSDGIYDTEIVVPPYDSVQVKVPATFGITSLTTAGRSIVNTGTVNYRVMGRLYVTTPYGRYRSPYDRAGMFNAISAIPR